MKPLQTRLQEARKRLDVPWEVLERDYFLSWILAGVSQTESLHSHLAFNGGTALKKCYFGEYRFSEDLDFSSLPGAPTGVELERAVKIACQTAAKILDEYTPIEIACERYIENEPHPGNQEAFVIHARFPWQKQSLTRVMIGTTTDEKVLKPPSYAPELPICSAYQI